MLTWDEVKEAFREASDMTPDDFERMVADRVPQTIMPKLISEVIEDFSVHTDDPEELASMVGTFLAGFHFGWIVASKATK